MIKTRLICIEYRSVIARAHIVGLNGPEWMNDGTNNYDVDHINMQRHTTRSMEAAQIVHAFSVEKRVALIVDGHVFF